MSSSKINLIDFLIPLEEIIRATNNLCPDNYINSGGFGRVYRGQLSERWQNRTAAIKRLNPGKQGAREFTNELELISRCNHVNIISFIGYCNEGGEMIIVSEYATNGSLDDYLIDRNKRCRMTWAQRLKICVGAAQGLWYLHSGVGDKNRVIHRDMKSANILLDENLEAKICDFGLSRLGPINKGHTALYTTVVGTNYYCDPAYYEGGVLTKESDVYSLGVILFEMLSGMLAYRVWSDGDQRGGQTLLPMVRRHYHHELHKIIDNDVNNDVDMWSLYTFKEIAYRCISHSPKERPTMDRVVEELTKALKYHENAIASHAMEESINISSSDELWLPNNYDNIIQRSGLPPTCVNKSEVFSLLSAGILIDGANKWFSLSKVNGKNCVMISGMELLNDEIILSWKSFPESRFPKVPKVGRSMAHMPINIPMLSLETSYVAFLIAKFSGRHGNKMNTRFYPLHSHFRLYNGNQEIKILSAVWKDKEWMEIELFQFTNYREVHDLKFDFRLHWGPPDYDIYVEGIEFRPINTGTDKEETIDEELHFITRKEVFQIVPLRMTDDIKSKETDHHNKQTNVEESDMDFLSWSLNHLYISTEEEHFQVPPMSNFDTADATDTCNDQTNIEELGMDFNGWSLDDVHISTQEEYQVPLMHHI